MMTVLLQHSWLQPGNIVAVSLLRKQPSYLPHLGVGDNHPQSQERKTPFCYKASIRRHLHIQVSYVTCPRCEHRFLPVLPPLL
jgi:hypothetical protein